MVAPSVSVLTPTFNRAHLLHRAYASLIRQTVRDFEWVVIDDGSADETPALLAHWQAEADFPIIWYRYTKNRGRNAAVNTGLRLLSGAYTVILDSDDALLDDAMEIIAYWRKRTQIDKIDSVYQLVFRLLDSDGNLFGSISRNTETKLPQSVMDISSKYMRYNLGATFDCKSASKTAIIRRFYYMELTDQEHCPERYTSARIANFYRSIFIDHPIAKYILNDNEPRLTDKQKVGIKWPRGNYLQALAILNDDFDYLRHNPKVFLNAARKVNRLGLHIGRSPLRQFGDLGHIRARLLWAMGAPGGLVGYFRDRLRGQRAPKADPDMSAWGPAAPPENPVLHLPPERFGRKD